MSEQDKKSPPPPPPPPPAPMTRIIKENGKQPVDPRRNDDNG